MILELKSVGCVIDTETKITYASYNKESREVSGQVYDKDSGVHLNDCSKEFIDSLTDDEIYLINENCFRKH